MKIHKREKLYEITQLLTLLWLFSGLWFIAHGNMKSSGVLCGALIITGLMARGFKYYIGRFKSEKSIQIFALLACTISITYYLHGGIFSSFRRSMIMLVIFLWFFNEKITVNKLTSIIFIGLLLNISYLFYSYFNLHSNRVSEIMNPNLYSPYFGFVFVFFSFLLLFKREKANIAILSLGCLLSLGAVFSLYSRGVIAGIFIAFLLLVLINVFQSTKLTFKTSFTFLILFTSLCFLFKAPLNQIIDKSILETAQITTGNLNTSIGHRIQMQQIGWKLIKEKPMTGWGREFQKRQRETVIDGKFSTGIISYNTLHNVYSDSWAKLGIFGFIISLLLSFSSLFFLFKSQKKYLPWAISISSFIFIISLIDVAMLRSPLIVLLILTSFIIKQNQDNRES